MTEIPPTRSHKAMLEKATGSTIHKVVQYEIDHPLHYDTCEHRKEWVSLESIQARDTKIADGLICSSVLKLGTSISCSEVQGFGGNCRCNNCSVYLRLRGLEK